MVKIKKIQIVNFTHEHIPDAGKLALLCYNEERAFCPQLPEMHKIPELSEFAQNRLGVAALCDGQLLGFLCFYSPWDNAFRSTARGTFSPIHAHGTVAQDRGEIYMAMYQAAAKKLVRDNVSSHSIGLYAHDNQGEKAFFTYGFGLRCIDAIRENREIELPSPGNHGFSGEIRMLEEEELPLLHPMSQALSSHMGESPCFMHFPPQKLEKWLEEEQGRGNIYFAAFDKGSPIAYIQIGEKGENFVTEHPKMKSICGAYCTPSYRSCQIMERLISCGAAALAKEGTAYLGVDYESFNPTANRFWSKHFSPYTHGLVRRIDEGALPAQRP